MTKTEELRNLVTSFNYYKRIRDFVVSAPMDQLGGMEIAQALIRLVIQKMAGIESEARKLHTKTWITWEGFNWASKS